jgi:hypothetical protein
VGKGTIVSGGTDGLYTVDFDYGSTRVDQLIDYFQTVIDDLETTITEAESEESTASIALAAAQSALNAKITTYADDDSKDNKQAVEDATEGVAEQAILKDKARIKIATLRYQKMALESRLASLQKIDTTERADVWCVDLTEDGSGAVGTIEINGEGPAKMLVPGCAAPEASDGIMTARGAQTPEQLFLNAAILPGWQKFSPTYRTGTISNIDYDADTCSVTLDAANSTAQNLGINQSSLLENVDVEYMSCNAGAFEDGDKVVVKFIGQSWSTPKVIGFVSNPKACGPAKIAFYVDNDTDLTYDTGFGTPVYVGDRVGSEVTTYPLTGLTRASYAAGTTRYNFGSSSPRVFVANPRIRFDVAWVKKKASDTYFEETHTTLYREQTYNKSVSADVDIAGLTSFYTILIFGTSTTYDRQDYTLVSGTDFDDSPIELMSGTGFSDTYNQTTNPAAPGDPYVVADYAEATSYHLEHYTVPTTINVRKLGEPDVYIQYTLESFGPPCELYDGTKNYDIYRNPDDLLEGTTTRKPPSLPMAIYKRAAGT